MILPIPGANPDASGKPQPNDRVPVLMEEVDSIQVFEDFDTRGDHRYPPVQRPPVFPQIFAPPASNPKP